MDDELMRVCVVGGNALAAFMSWRFQASNACDVTLVWRRNFDHVRQYGITFRSQKYGNERWKPIHVALTPEDAAAQRESPYDYVVLCIKALPDIYDFGSVIETVVTPKHTCILVNTTSALGVETALQDRFPDNVVLSLVSCAEFVQLGPSEFEHTGPAEVWVGPTMDNKNVPPKLEEDMAIALTMTLSSGQIDCRVSPNIRQQQYERVIGVILETPNHQALLEKVGVRDLVYGIMDEMLALAASHNCTFPADFKDRAVAEMLAPPGGESAMYLDYVARRPLEVETCLGAPLKLARAANIPVPRIETVYTILHSLNIANQQRVRGLSADGGSAAPQGPASPSGPLPVQRGPPPPAPPHHVNGGGGGPGMMMPRPARPRNSSMVRRPGPQGPPQPMPINGYPPRPPLNGGGGGGGGGGSRQPSRRGSIDGLDPEEFSHVLNYTEEIADSLVSSSYEHDQPDMPVRDNRDMRPPHPREMGWAGNRDQPPPPRMMRRPPQGPPISAGMGMMNMGPRRYPPTPSASSRHASQMYEDDDGADYGPVGPAPPTIDPDNFDMMSMTSRKNRIGTSVPVRQLREPDMSMPPSASSRGQRFGPHHGPRDRLSQLNSIPTVGENILDDPMMSYSSDRYGGVDRAAITESRTNSLTSQRLEELGHRGPMMPAGMMMANGGGGMSSRRSSQAPPPMQQQQPYGGGPSSRGGNNNYGPSGGGPRPQPQPQQQQYLNGYTNGGGGGGYMNGSGGGGQHSPSDPLPPPHASRLMSGPGGQQLAAVSSRAAAPPNQPQLSFVAGASLTNISLNGSATSGKLVNKVHISVGAVTSPVSHASRSSHLVGVGG